MRAAAALVAALCLAASAPAAETVVIPVEDLLHDIPNFDNAPDFNLNAPFNGGMPVGDLKKDSKRDRKARERILTEMVEEMYPDATVRLWRGNFIIRFP